MQVRGHAVYDSFVSAAGCEARYSATPNIACAASCAVSFRWDSTDDSFMSKARRHESRYGSAFDGYYAASCKLLVGRYATHYCSVPTTGCDPRRLRYAIFPKLHFTIPASGAVQLWWNSTDDRVVPTTRF